VGGLHAIRKNRCRARAAGGQAIGKTSIVELDARDKRRRFDALRLNGEPGSLHLTGRDRLQHGLHLAGKHLAGKIFEGDFDILSSCKVRSVDVPLVLAGFDIRAANYWWYGSPNVAVATSRPTNPPVSYAGAAS
jgi:hypothetical protein